MSVVEVRIESCKLTIWQHENGEQFVNIDGQEDRTTPIEDINWESYQYRLTEEECNKVWNTFKYDISESANNF